MAQNNENTPIVADTTPEPAPPKEAPTIQVMMPAAPVVTPTIGLNFVRPGGEFLLDDGVTRVDCNGQPLKGK